MALAVCRIAKLKSIGGMSGSEKHTSRDRETLNADPDVSNIRLIGGANDPDLETLVRDKIGDQTIRSDAVLAVEMLLSASPEYFRPDNPSAAGTYDQKRLEDFTDVTTQWLREQYKDKVVRAELHLDEATPHIHAYIVPLKEDGKLSCKALFGGRQKLSQLQDSFASAVSHLGIERGVKGSPAQHTKIKKYYAAVNENSLTLDLDSNQLSPTPGESAIDHWERVKETLQPTLDVINHQLSDRQWAIAEKELNLQKALASEKERQRLEEKVKELEAENLKWRQQAEQLRDLPLEDVAYELGLDPDDKCRWKGQGYIISINGSKFYDFSAEQQGGGGAIDLVMHVQGCEFKQAVAWLHDRFGESGMLRAVTHLTKERATQIAQTEPAPKFVPPIPDESRWQGVQRYLTQERKLPESWIKGLHQQGLVYADSKQNAVFIQHSLDGDVTGAFLRGTVGKDNTFIGLAPGTKRSAGWFYINLGGSEDDPIQTVVLTKSPIDALSKTVLDSPHSTRTLYLSADSVRSLPVEFLRGVPQVIAAYDNDSAGNETARQIKQLIPQATRSRAAAKDWNEELQALLQRSQEQDGQKQKSKSQQMEL